MGEIIEAEFWDFPESDATEVAVTLHSTIVTLEVGHDVVLPDFIVGAIDVKRLNQRSVEVFWFTEA